ALGVLIAGDMVLPRISTNVSVPSSQPDGNPLALFLASLERFEALPAGTLVLPSHGLPFRGVRERMVQLREHHRQRLAELAQACDRPRTAAEVIGTLFRRKLDSQQLYFAMGEAMAHLHYLHAEARLSRIDERGLLRYTTR
ncbi:MAG: MBL fold metallo-hydrolase, partial [Burkholderiales bacterium]|nr:MBL fold metallo-hydrolase [Burkholderiales bacterium]